MSPHLGALVTRANCTSLWLVSIISLSLSFSPAFSWIKRWIYWNEYEAGKRWLHIRTLCVAYLCRKQYTNHLHTSILYIYIFIAHSHVTEPHNLIECDIDIENGAHKMSERLMMTIKWIKTPATYINNRSIEFYFIFGLNDVKSSANKSSQTHTHHLLVHNLNFVFHCVLNILGGEYVIAPCHMVSIYLYFESIPNAHQQPTTRTWTNEIK